MGKLRHLARCSEKAVSLREESRYAAKGKDR